MQESLNQRYTMYMEILNPNKQVIFETLAHTINGTASFTYKVPSTVSGGDYTIKVLGPKIQNNTKTMTITEEPKVQIHGKAKFTLDHYQPGDVVSGQVFAALPNGSRFTNPPTFSFSVKHNSKTISGSAQQQMALDG